MAVHEHLHRGQGNLSLPSTRGHESAAEVETVEGAPTNVAAAYAVTALRLLTGFIFLWAFVDKLFGLGYATQSEKAWINGGQPAMGFLKGVAVGPMRETFNDMAGQAWVDWLFMLALLGVGLAVMLGVALRPSAVAGSLLMLSMWLAEFPPAKFAFDGTPTGSTNPFNDYHIMYAVILIVLATISADKVYGLGRIWRGLPFVRDHSWLH